MKALLFGISTLFLVLHASGHSQSTRLFDPWQMPSWMPDFYSADKEGVPRWKSIVQQAEGWLPVRILGTDGGCYNVRGRLKAEQAKSRHLERELEKQKVDKQWDGQERWLLRVCNLVMLAFILISLAWRIFPRRGKLIAKSKRLRGEDKQFMATNMHQRCKDDVLEDEFDSVIMPQEGDFPFHIYDEPIDQGISRSIKVQCPGVRHADVHVDIIFNGCVVTISRQASQGVQGTEWSQRFQFKSAEGSFEFKEDQARLEHGILTLTCLSYAFQRRPFRFPIHFDLAAEDVGGFWDHHEDHNKKPTSGAIANNLQTTSHGLSETVANCELEPHLECNAHPSVAPVIAKDNDGTCTVSCLDAKELSCAWPDGSSNASDDSNVVPCQPHPSSEVSVKQALVMKEGVTYSCEASDDFEEQFGVECERKVF
jgi:HSP20 family molecular chaperone IbpA